VVEGAYGHLDGYGGICGEAARDRWEDVDVIWMVEGSLSSPNRV
jgi:hypothetical protein